MPRTMLTLSDAQRAEVETLAAVLTAEQVADYFGIARRTFYALKQRDAGLAAQRKTIDDFAASRVAVVIGRFTEVESGRNPDRTELKRALHLARVTGATLVIAKLDRLSRNAAFLLTLRDSGVRFLAVDMPEANDLTVVIMALVAQADREAISRRTKEALAVAKARGVKLGNPNGAAALKRAGKGGAPLRAVVAANADTFAADLAEVIADIRASGATSLRAIAGELNARGMMTRRGGRWQVSNVRNLWGRIDGVLADVQKI
jgi:DNA invertase Pin-like site-specific DNA recombinase